MTLLAPFPLTDAHDLSPFSCGEPSLDDWLKRRALTNQAKGASRTYVVAEGQRVVGFYSLAAGALELNMAPGPIRRNMPDPIPVVLLGRLATDQAWQGRGLGVALLQDAVMRTRMASEILGIRGIMVHAISENARAFYKRHGFLVSPIEPMTLILPLSR